MFVARLAERKAKGQKASFKNVQNRKRRKRKWAPMPNPISKEEETLLIQEALNLTFECQRLHCRLLPKSCVQRQKSWDTEIYEGCIDCKQGLGVARKMKYKNREKEAA